MVTAIALPVPFYRCLSSPILLNEMLYFSKQTYFLLLYWNLRGYWGNSYDYPQCTFMEKYKKNISASPRQILQYTLCLCDQPRLRSAWASAQSDQSSLIMCILQPPRYPKRDEQEPLPYLVDVQADLSLCWSHALLKVLSSLVRLFLDHPMKDVQTSLDCQRENMW